MKKNMSERGRGKPDRGRKGRLSWGVRESEWYQDERESEWSGIDRQSVCSWCREGRKKWLSGESKRCQVGRTRREWHGGRPTHTLQSHIQPDTHQTFRPHDPLVHTQTADRTDLGRGWTQTQELHTQQTDRTNPENFDSYTHRVGKNGQDRHARKLVKTIQSICTVFAVWVAKSVLVEIKQIKQQGPNELFSIWVRKSFSARVKNKIQLSLDCLQSFFVWQN